MVTIRKDLRKRIEVILREDNIQDVYGYVDEEEIINVAVEKTLKSMEDDLLIKTHNKRRKK